MTPLYTEELAGRYRARAQKSLWFSVAIVIIAWGACAVLCTQVRTANAGQMFRWVMGLSILSGWIAIAVLTLIFRPARAEGRHMAGVLREEAEEMRGILTVEDDAFQIPRGIRICRARLETAEGPVFLRLSAQIKGRVPQGTPVRLRVQRQFITGFEVEA